jgi:hypothetical protein
MSENGKRAAEGLPQIAVVNWKPREKGALRGYLDICIAESIVVKGFKLFEKNGDRWVSAPADRYKKRDGSTGYAPVVEFNDRNTEREFGRDVLADLDRYIQENRDGN